MQSDPKEMDWEVTPCISEGCILKEFQKNFLPGLLIFSVCICEIIDEYVMAPFPSTDPKGYIP